MYLKQQTQFLLFQAIQQRKYLKSHILKLAFPAGRIIRIAVFQVREQSIKSATTLSLHGQDQTLKIAKEKGRGQAK
jgi:hypothetical protein